MPIYTFNVRIGHTWEEFQIDGVDVDHAHGVFDKYHLSRHPEWDEWHLDQKHFHGARKKLSTRDERELEKEGKDGRR